MKLELKYPLKYISVNQSFGQNATDIYGKAGMKGHSGIDFYAPHGTPIYATHDGYAQYQIGNDKGHGVIVVTDKKYDYKDTEVYFKTVSWHLVDFTREPQYKSPIADKTGFVKVKTGDLIGYADNTGNSTGSHLHFELKPVEGEFGFWRNIEQSNGYYGAIDPKPYLPQQPIEEFKKIMKLGDENMDVQKLQAFFLRTGRMKPILKGFGYYGKATQEAVKKFQVENGIPHNNGVQVGKLTLLKLNKLYE